jgi:signal transduction histidine kinase
MKKAQSRSKLKAEKKRFVEASKKLAKSTEEAPLSLLAAGVAHEFHNLLGAADGHAQWALESADPKDMKEALEIVRLVCKRSSQITRALQGFSQPREERRDWVGLPALFDELRKIYGTLCNEKGIELQLKSPPLKVWGSKIDIEEVLVNLIKNAIEAMSETEGTKRIEVYAEKSPKKIIIHVRDTGPGIPSLHREHIFRPFWTTKGVLKNLHENPASKGNPQQGSGLGLYISRMRILEHRGQLKIKESKSGTHFVIELPA